MLIVFFVLLLVIVPCVLSKQGDKEFGPNWDRTEISPGTFTQTIYSNDINLKDSNGIYKPLSQVVNLKSQNDAITISWNGKTINMSSYVKVPLGQQKKSEKIGLGMTSGKNTDKGIMSWEHKFSNITNQHKFGYDITYDGVSCTQKGQKYYCDELVIDFGKWVEKNLTVASGLNSIEVSGNDLSDLDPTVIINGTNKVNATYVHGTSTTTSFANSSLYVDGAAPKKPLIIPSLSSIQSYFIISEAKLYLYAPPTQTFGVTVIDAFTINHSWREGIVTDSLGYDTNDNIINGSTWLERYYGNNLNNGNSPFSESDADWEVVGLGIHQDYNGTLLDNITFPANGDETWYSWNVTNAFKWWILGTKQNYGVILMDNSNGAGEIYFWGDESSDTSLRPYFNITYTVSPSINSNLTIPSTPLWGNNVTLQVNATNSSLGNSLRWANFTLTAPNGTAVINNVNGSRQGGLWNSSLYNIWFDADGEWNWNINLTDWSGLYSYFNTSFTILDVAPAITSVDFNATPTSGKNLSILCPAVDAESNNISKFYRWYVNYTEIVYTEGILGGSFLAGSLNLTVSCLVSDQYKNSSWMNSSTASLGDTDKPHFSTSNLSNQTQYHDTPTSLNISVWDDSSQIKQCWVEVIHPGGNKSNNSMTFTLGQNIIANVAFINYTAYDGTMKQYNFSRVSCWDAMDNYNSTYINHPFNITQRFVNVSNISVTPSSIYTTGSANVSILCAKNGEVTISSASYTVDPPSTNPANYSLSVGADGFWSATYSSADTGTHSFTNFYCTDSKNNIGSNVTSINLVIDDVPSVVTTPGGGGGAVTTRETNISALLQSVVSGIAKCGNGICEKGETRDSCYEDCKISFANLTPFVRFVFFGVIIIFGYLVIKSQMVKRRKPSLG